MDPTISSLMRAAERGDRSASEALFATLYSELQGPDHPDTRTARQLEELDIQRQ